MQKEKLKNNLLSKMEEEMIHKHQKSNAENLIFKFFSRIQLIFKIFLANRTLDSQLFRRSRLENDRMQKISEMEIFKLINLTQKVVPEEATLSMRPFDQSSINREAEDPI
jgi:hypothetical protein